ncbi:hypothetical protein [Phyllobacterium phragmitis]|nr:hypothetical protein [Phyllobacterium phragmitis]
MKFLISTLGGLQMLGGIAVLITAASSIHEILGAVAFGLGVICLALGAVIDRLESLLPKSEQKSRKVPPVATIEMPTMNERGWSSQ